MKTVTDNWGIRHKVTTRWFELATEDEADSKAISDRKDEPTITLDVVEQELGIEEDKE